MTKPEILAEIQRLKSFGRPAWEWRPQVKKLIAQLEALEDPFAENEFFGEDQAPDWQDTIQQDTIGYRERNQ